ncbi:MAG: non-ribosomal peptide synthetase, partial [bacterium]|nr:non-ribosomal peptide synthetase [bacterium]
MERAMTLEELLSRLRRLDVVLRTDGDRLRFSAPRGVLNAELRAELQAHKEEIIAFLRSAPAVGVTAPAIVPAPRDREQEGLPTSFSQERQWFLVKFEPDTAAYNLPDAERLRGRLEVAALEESFHEIVRRHEVLRTRFHEVDGRPFQVISPELRLPLPVVELGELPPAAREQEARRLAAEDARRLFDLEAGPLIRMTLLRLEE